MEWVYCARDAAVLQSVKPPGPSWDASVLWARMTAQRLGASDWKQSSRRTAGSCCRLHLSRRGIDDASGELAAVEAAAPGRSQSQSQSGGYVSRGAALIWRRKVFLQAQAPSARRISRPQGVYYYQVSRNSSTRNVSLLQVAAVARRVEQGREPGVRKKVVERRWSGGEGNERLRPREYSRLPNYLYQTAALQLFGMESDS